MAATES